MENLPLRVDLKKFVTKNLLISLEAALRKMAIITKVFFDVDNLILKESFVITNSRFPCNNKGSSSGDIKMKNWKALILKITLLVLVGIVMLTG